MEINSSYLHSPSFEYYLQKDNNPKLMLVERNKRFIKKSKDLFLDCSNIIDDLKENKIDLENLPKFIEHYKKRCLNKKFHLNMLFLIKRINYEILLNQF